MEKNLDNLIEKHKHAEQIKNLIEKYEDQLEWNELNEMDVFQADNMLTEEVEKSLENDKNQKLNEFKQILLGDFDKLEENIKKKSREIIIKNFPKEVQQKIKDNEVKYFDRVEGEDGKKHTERMKTQFKALLVDDYIKNPEKKVSLEMVKSNQTVKKLVYGAAEAQYINILSKSRDEINEMKENELATLVNQIHDNYGLKKTDEELEIDSERSFEKIDNSNNITHQEYPQPSWGNFFFESGKALMEKGKEFIAGISRYFTSL